MPTAVAGRAWLWNWLYDGTGFPRQKSAEAGQPHNPGVPRGGGGAAAAPTEISFTATEAANLMFSFLQPLPTQQLTSRTSPLVGLSVCSLTLSQEHHDHMLEKTECVGGTQTQDKLNT